MPNANILLYCRPGFEKEAAAEIIDLTGQAGIFGYVKSKADSGYVVFVCQPECTVEQLDQAIHYDSLVFARQCIFTTDLLNHLPVDDRITPVLDSLGNTRLDFNEAWLETPDTNEGKQLSAFCKKFSNPLIRKLENEQLLVKASPWRLHLFFLSSTAAYIGVSNINNSSNLPMGIPRLRMPRSAPSRSTLKLDEAFNFMLNENEQETHLKNGMTAVDLGACPGGWTWQLVNRGMRVTAIDNGPMNEELMDTGMVEHLRVDGFRYQPEKPVDWLVCDMVERPLHISRLMAHWLTEGLCRHAAFNLKLPMKKRYDVVKQCKEQLQDDFRQAGIDKEIRIKQLYHDREEVTCVVL